MTGDEATTDEACGPKKEKKRLEIELSATNVATRESQRGGLHAPQKGKAKLERVFNCTENIKKLKQAKQLGRGEQCWEPVMNVLIHNKIRKLYIPEGATW